MAELLYAPWYGTSRLRHGVKYGAIQSPLDVLSGQREIPPFSAMPQKRLVACQQSNQCPDRHKLPESLQNNRIVQILDRQKFSTFPFVRRTNRLKVLSTRTPAARASHMEQGGQCLRDVWYSRVLHSSLQINNDEQLHQVALSCCREARACAKAHDLQRAFLHKTVPSTVVMAVECDTTAGKNALFGRMAFPLSALIVEFRII